MKYFKEGVLKYFKISMNFKKYFKVKYFIMLILESTRRVCCDRQRGSGSTGAQVSREPATLDHRTPRSLSNLQISTTEEAKQSLDSLTCDFNVYIAVSFQRLICS